jgi:hypothetical protein
MLSKSCSNKALVYSAENNVWTPAEPASINGHIDFFVPNHGLSVHITGIEGWKPVRAAACNGQMEVNR